MTEKNNNLIIASWNLCLGLTRKRDYVRNILNTMNIDVLNLQETELDPKTNVKHLSIKGYSLELEMNDTKIRVATYVRNNLKYKRRRDLEINNGHIVIIDLTQRKVKRLANLYRPFKPPILAEREFFNMQIETLNP